MRTILINKLKYNIYCEDNSIYGALIPFSSGLNIIFGPNSVGKSSIITGIIYGLGAEKALGIFKNNQNPFKPEFYRSIDGKKIISSHLLLEITNGLETITIKRNIVGTNNFCTVKYCEVEHYDMTDKYINFLVTDDVFSEHGFQSYLFKFIGWDIVKVSKYDGSTANLYMENMIPLFFVEQRAGWSQIQARQVIRYQIQDLKKIVFEYLMGLDKFNVHQREIELDELKRKIKSLKKEFEWKKSNIFISGNAHSSDDIALFVEKPSYGKYDICDLISLLKEELESTKEKININSQKSDTINSLLNSRRDELSKVSHLRRNASEKVNSLSKEIAGYQNYISKIELNRKKNRQLEKLNEIPFDYNISLCPVCGSELSDHDEYHCKLCKSDIQRISTPQENLLFLEDEKASFEKILNSKKLELKKAEESLLNLKEKESSTKKILDHQMQTYYGDELQNLREQIVKVDSLVLEINKYENLLNQWNDLRSDLDNIYKFEDEKKSLDQEIQKYKQSQNDQEILHTLVLFFQLNLKKLNLFKANKSLISSIKIDEHSNYEPYLDFYDLYNINSSSDNIRIILSYYLSLLQTSLKLTDYSQIRYPSLLILDEPRQQNLDDKEIKSFVEIVNRLPSLEWQIILTTFDIHEKDFLSQYIIFEMKNESDFLLKKIS